MLEACQWIRETWLSVTLRESTWGYPAVGALHVLALAWFGGAVVVANLRLLDWAMRGIPISSIHAWLRPWKRLGLGALLMTGGLLFWLEPVGSYSSAAFRAKMALLVLAVIVTPSGKPTAMLSFGLWLGVIFAARFMAFF